jgi:D-lyxose ketol-isomerase
VARAFTAEPAAAAHRAVIMCNGDQNDNRFLERLSRFPEIGEDEKPRKLLYTEYPAANWRIRGGALWSPTACI